MNFKQFSFFAALFMLLAACSDNGPKSTFTIDGTAEGFSEGAQLQLVNFDGQVLDTISIANGKFSYTGQADSVGFFMLNAIDNEFSSVSFFNEPGTIKIALKAASDESTVGGTISNDSLQSMMNAVNPYYEKIAELEKIISSDTAQTYDQWAIGERYNQLVSEISGKMKDAAKWNIDNELGYMLVTTFIDPSENSELLGELIAKMPEKYKNRPQIAAIEEKLKAAESTSIGQKIEDFSLNTPQGEPLSVMSEVQKNKVTILDFWASWCGPCRREMPFMKQLYADYREKGLGIVGISLDESATDWNKAIEDLKIEWPQMSDLLGWNSSAAKTFNVNAIPFLVIVDNQGTILQKGLRGEELKQFIEQQLK